MILTERSHFENIFKEHYNALCNYVFQIVQDDSTSEDIVQDVFVHLWKQRGDLDIKDSLINYLISSCKNKALEYKRKKKRRIEAEVDISVLSSNSKELEAERKNILLREKIFYSIRQLPPKCGEVFTLSKIEGLTYAEIAVRLDISVKTVENHMALAFKTLRKLLDKQGIPR